MKINKVSEYILSDDNDNEIRIKHMDGGWHFIVDEESVFSFAAEECNKMMSIFKEIRKLANQTLLELEDMCEEYAEDDD